MGTWRSSQRSSPLTKASLMRERAAEYRRMAEDDWLGASVRESYLDLARACEALAHQYEAIVAEKRAWEMTCAYSYSENRRSAWETGSRSG